MRSIARVASIARSRCTSHLEGNNTSLPRWRYAPTLTVAGCWLLVAGVYGDALARRLRLGLGAVRVPAAGARRGRQGPVRADQVTVDDRVTGTGPRVSHIHTYTLNFRCTFSPHNIRGNSIVIKANLY